MPPLSATSKGPHLSSTRRERPPAGHKGDPCPTRNPVAIATATKPTQGQGLGVTAATASPVPAKRHPARISARQAGPGKRVAPNAVTASHIQPPGRTAVPPALPNVPPPPPTASTALTQARRAVRQTPATGSRARPKGTRYPGEVTPSHVSTGISHSSTAEGQGRQALEASRIGNAASPQVKATATSTHADPFGEATPRVHGPRVQRGPLLKSAGSPLKYGARQTLKVAAQHLHQRARHLQPRKDLSNYQGPERNAYAQRDKGPTSPNPPSPLRSPPDSRAANPRQGAHLRDPETKEQTKASRKDENQQGRSDRESGSPLTGTRSTDDKPEQQGPLAGATPLTSPPQASPSVKTKRLPPLEQGRMAKKKEEEP
ncbi:hypothetical protein WOLCODRAFT_157714 [Wolfiporia cocos MD-104 SS10]|uniref:Uncharacterized protein n=1 Tax=Wolfiporia cocos (strain MD-104) TaxID=742152 RepID=A0A2H3JB24_WOLCO|nr:hypothetical protein WOLCODRAFT_157714 [Wolfiporia cocos MD-104 SS10]